MEGLEKYDYRMMSRVGSDEGWNMGKRYTMPQVKYKRQRFGLDEEKNLINAKVHGSSLVYSC